MPDQPPPPPSPGISAIEIYQTVPKTIAMHTIEDHQLKSLTNMSRPLTVAVAGIAAGATISLLPVVLDALPHIGTAAFGAKELLYTVIDGVALVATVFFGIRAANGEREAKQLVKEIQSRTRKPL